MPFKFNLQSVLDYRQSLVDTAQTELMAAQAALQQEEKALDALRAHERTTARRLHDAQHKPRISIPTVLQIMEESTLVGMRINDQVQLIQRRAAEVERARAHLAELLKDVKSLEKLRERRAEEHEQEERRLETAEMGELAALQFRKSRAAS